MHNESKVSLLLGNGVNRISDTGEKVGECILYWIEVVAEKKGFVL